MNGKGGEKCIYIYFKIAGASDMEWVDCQCLLVHTQFTQQAQTRSPTSLVLNPPIRVSFMHLIPVVISLHHERL
jgi:hypothetical protein